MVNYLIRNKDRICWADIAKGLGIILVVLGHTAIPCKISEYFGVPYFLQNWIYAFHMPLFFLISGILTNWKCSYFSFFMRKSKSLLIVYVIYSILNVLLGFGKHDIVSVLMYGWGGQALWFLPVLFFSLVTAKFFSDKTIVFGIFIMSLIAWMLSLNHIQIRYSLSSVPYATSFVLIGRLIPRFINRILQDSGKKHVLYLLFTFILTSVIAYFFRLDICNNKIIPLIPIMIGAISGSVLTIIISLYISKVKIANFIFKCIGQNTLEIMAFHQSIIYFIPVSLFFRILLLPLIIMGIIVLKKYCCGSKKRMYNGA